MDRAHSPSRRAFLADRRPRDRFDHDRLVGAAQAETAAPEDIDAGITTLTDAHYYLTDVRLEEGFEYQDDMVSGTRTGLHTVEIQGRQHRGGARGRRGARRRPAALQRAAAS